MAAKLFTFLFLLITAFANAQSDYPLETVLQKGHSDYIKAYDFSADGRFLASGGFDNVLLLWDVQSGKQIRTITGHTGRIRSIEFSPDQKHLLSNSADNTIKIFNVLTGEQVHSFEVFNHDLRIAFYSSNGKYVYGLDNRDGVFVWDAASGEEVEQFTKDGAAHLERNLIHPEENQILTGGSYKGVYAVSLISNDTLLEIPFDKSHSLSYSLNGEYIAVSSRKLFAAVYNAQTGKLINEFRDGEERCDGCNTKHVFSPDSKYLVTMSSKVGAILWDVKSGKKIRKFLTADDRPDQLKFSKDGTYLMIHLGDHVYVYETKSGVQKIHTESDKYEYLDVKMSPDETVVALPNDNGGIDLWSIKRGKIIKTIKGYLNVANESGLDLSYSNWTQQHVLSYIQHKRKILLSPDNQHVLIGGIDSSAMLINLNNGRVVTTFQNHTKAVVAFDFTSDGEYLATAGGDRKIQICETKTGKVVQTLFGHQETVFDLKFSQSGEFLISGAWDGTMRLWKWRSGKYEYVPIDKSSAYSVGFTPNELYLVTTDLSNNLQFWERDARKPFRTLIGHTSIVSGFDFSPNDKEIVTGSWDGKVKVWDILTGMLVGRMDQHNGQVYTVKYDPKDRFIASAGADNKIVLWDPKTNKVIKELYGHANAVTCIDITKDGRYMVSISIDGLMKVWDLNTYEIVYSRIQLSKSEWLATNSNGYFDGSSKALNWVNYVKGNQVVKISSLFEKYYTPDLIKRIQDNEEGLNDRSGLLEQEFGELPVVNVALSSTGSRSIVLDADSVFKAQNDNLPIEIIIGEHKTGLEEIRIYSNGKLIIQESLEENISFRGIGEKKYGFEIPLSNGLNEITAVVINEKRTESNPTKVLVEYDGIPSKTDLYMLTIGINNYQNPAYKLDYAVNDAKDFMKAIKAGADSLFNSVVSYSILNAEANKENITAAIEEIKKVIGPEDVFLFYYAGHGVMSNEATPEASEFFIVTHDVTNLYDAPEVIREKAISAGELMSFSIDIAAEKQLFILDACHSGGAIESFAVRGSEREKALAQLARNTGTFFLTAAQDAQYANEAGKLNHGLFTYALLEILKGSDLNGSGDKVTVNEIKSYVEERVPELTEQYQGSPQYPTGYSFGRDFPIVIVK